MRETKTKKKPKIPRGALLRALTAMPDEAFGWFVAWANGSMLQYPDGLGGFLPDSREAIMALRVAAQKYLDREAG